MVTKRACKTHLILTGITRLSRGRFRRPVWRLRKARESGWWGENKNDSHVLTFQGGRPRISRIRPFILLPWPGFRERSYAGIRGGSLFRKHSLWNSKMGPRFSPFFCFPASVNAKMGYFAESTAYGIAKKGDFERFWPGITFAITFANWSI